MANACLLDGSELRGRQLKVAPKRTNVPGMKAGRGGRGGRGAQCGTVIIGSLGEAALLKSKEWVGRWQGENLETARRQGRSARGTEQPRRRGRAGERAGGRSGLHQRRHRLGAVVDVAASGRGRDGGQGE